MGSIDIIKSVDEVTPKAEDILSNLMPESIALMDFLGEIYLQFLEPLTPVGATEELLNQTQVIVEDPLSRWIGSLAPHFDWIVPGHTISGINNSEKQRKWWFWYLANVLGGSYDVKYGTGNKTPEYDYPLMAFDMADPTVEQALEEYGNWIVS